MAEEEILEESAEDEAFGKWLAGLQGPSDEEESREEKADPVEIARRTQKVVGEFITEQQTDKMVDKFMETASEDAKRLFSIYRRGDEDPKQLHAIMELAKVKAKEAQTPTPEAQEEVEKQAEKLAKEAYGVGPISGGQAASELTPQEYFDQRAEAASKAARKSGDTHGHYELFRDLKAEAEASTD